MINRVNGAQFLYLTTMAAVLAIVAHGHVKGQATRNAPPQQARSAPHESILEYSPNKEPLAARKVLDSTRPVFLVNMFPDVVIIAFRIDGGSWRPVEPIPQTCKIQDEKQCSELQLWKYITPISCDKTVTLDLMGEDGGAWKGKSEVMPCEWSYKWFVLHR